MPSPPAHVLDIAGITKRFGTTVAVDDVTFAVTPGETISLLGPSGCGKTTLLRLIAGFEAPDAGQIEIAGVPMAGKRPYERNVGLLFQHYALFPHMTVAENVAYGLKNRGWPKPDIPKRVQEMLRLVQLPGFERRRPREMSGGQQQRVALARVLATRPELVLLDEPLSALDAKLREELRLELKRILQAVGSTTIVVTHDQEEAMSLADRIIVMNRGRIEQQGTPDEIYKRPRTAFVAGFVGRANWFHGRLEEPLGGGLRRFTTERGTRLAVLPPADPEAAEHWSLCVRPERMLLGGGNAAAPAPGNNQLGGRVVEVVNLGALFQYVVDAADGRMTVVEVNRAGAVLRPGDAVTLLFRAEDGVLLRGLPL
jgi:putative spermidine/putrescine transport system ATP-binding protein/putrescine transport system ATP-binding protein